MHSARYSLLKLFAQTASGKHVGNPTIDHFRVQRFKLEPSSLNSHIDLDGEIHNTASVEVEMIPGYLNVFAKPPISS